MEEQPPQRQSQPVRVVQVAKTPAAAPPLGKTPAIRPHVGKAPIAKVPLAKPPWSGGVQASASRPAIAKRPTPPGSYTTGPPGSYAKGGKGFKDGKGSFTSRLSEGK